MEKPKSEPKLVCKFCETQLIIYEFPDENFVRCPTCDYTIPAVILNGKPESQCRCDEPKLDERLLSDEEIKQAWLKSDKSVYSFYNKGDKMHGRDIAEAQLAKDQRFEKILLDEFEKLLIDEKTECRAKVERIYEVYSLRR